MSSTRPPLSRNTTSPGALYGCRDRALSSPDDYCPGGSHGRAYGSVDGVPTCASPKPLSRYPTPPHTTSPPHSNASTPDSSDESMPRSTASPQQGTMADYFPRSSPPSNPRVPIVTIRGSRSPTEDLRAQPDIQVSQAAYSLVAHLGRGFHPECITISAKKGNALVIVADRWDMEDCRYEWVCRFDRDADMSSVHANFDSGVLRVTVRRIPAYRLLGIY